MPRKKLEEKDQELDVKKVEKKETFATRWFKDHAVDSASDLKLICGLTSRTADEQFHITVSSGNTEVFAVVFYGTFLTILDWLRSKQKQRYNKFSIEIGNSVNLGYTNNTDQENEKVGNFMPVMEYIGINRNLIDDNTNEDDENRTSAACIAWMALNTKSNVQSYKEIQETAFDRLKTEFHTNLRTSEAVIPLFCVFMDNLTNHMRFKFQEAEGTDISEVSMNVFGLFDIFYSFDADANSEIIEFAPSYAMKLATKSDEVACRESQ